MISAISLKKIYKKLKGIFAKKSVTSLKKINCKDDVLIIKAGCSSDCYGFRKSGYTLAEPYRDRNIFTRILREICFLFHIQKPWFNRELKFYDVRYVIVKDPLITKEFLVWLNSIFTQSKLIYYYDNAVGSAKHLMPYLIPTDYKIWSYVYEDCIKYNLNYCDTPFYCNNFVFKSTNKTYDILFVGKDKGRLSFLKDLEAKLNKLDFKTKFVITVNGRFYFKDKNHSDMVSYIQICKWISESRAILNVASNNTHEITIRDMESLFNHVKLITTNIYIKETEIYHPNNVFILNESNINELPAFMDKPYVEIFNSLEKRFSIESYINKLIK